jgi:hypothetical protein
MRLGYAECGPDGVTLSSLKTGGDLDGDSPVSAFLVSRLDFDVQALEIPNLPEKEAEGLIRYRLRALYPGNPNETVFDFHRRQQGARSRVVVFISNRSRLDKYRSKVPEKPVLLPYCLIEHTARILENVRVWFCHASWLELSVFREGFLVSSTVVRRTTENEPDCARLDAELPEEVRALPALVIASESEVGQIRKVMEGHRCRDVRFLDYQELAAMHKKIDGLFRVEKRTSVLRTPMARIVGLSAVVVVLGILFFFKQLRIAEDNFARLQNDRAELESQSGRRIALERAIDELSVTYSRLETKRPKDVYRLLSELARVLRDGVQIRGLVVRGDGFQVEAAGSNPLRVMEGFHGNASFTGVKLSQVVPDAGSGPERFSFTGEFHAP